MTDDTEYTRAEYEKGYGYVTVDPKLTKLGSNGLVTIQFNRSVFWDED